MDTGIITVNTYLVQAIVGLVLSIGMVYTIFPDFFAAAGLILPMGFGQGTGQALNFGKIYESMGFTNGASFGLSVAAIGFLVGCLVGVLYLNILKKRGKLKVQEERKEIANDLNSDIYAPDEAPLTESVDKLTMQLGFVFGVYIVTYLVILGLSFLAENYLGNFGVSTLKPLFWGFNFLFGSVFAIVAKKIVSKLRKAKIMNHAYINDYMMNRLSGVFFDIMIVAGIAAINWQELKGYLWPLLIICTLGGIATFLYLKYVCKKIYPEYEHEAFFSMFGMLTGTASTGMILLREIDPNYETPAADNLVLQQLPAILFGAPLLLLMTFAGQNVINTLIALAIFTAMFVIYNIILLRKLIFKKKAKSE
jgi:ESS family glutamate:Na+ symporter